MGDPCRAACCTPGKAQKEEERQLALKSAVEQAEEEEEGEAGKAAEEKEEELRKRPWGHPAPWRCGGDLAATR